MLRLQTIAPEQATGAGAEAYKVFPSPDGGGAAPLQMISVSPALVIMQAGAIKYFMSHSKLGTKLTRP
ncbi:hypothetical protein DFAR_2520004 [Desulfarculales bacterium]